MEGEGIDKGDCAEKYNGETCTVTCLNEYQGDNATYYCIPEQGRFRGSGPTCEKKRCGGGSLPADLNTTDCNNKDAGEWCQVWCPSGYEVRSGLLQCNNANEFEGDLPTCERLKCADYDYMPTGIGVDNSDCEQTQSGGNCTVKCQQNYAGNATVVNCTDDGLFVGSAPVCELTACTVPPSLTVIPGVVHTCSSARHDETCVAKCDVGYLDRVVDVYCNAPELVFDPIVCFKQVCDDNFPHGEGVDESDCLNKVLDDTCVPSCMDGYTVETAATNVSCTATGAFSDSTLTCARAVCPDLETINADFGNASMYHTCSSVSFGDSCSVTCAPGYMLFGSTKSLTCEAAGGSVSLMEVNASGGLSTPSVLTCVGNVCTIGIPSRLGLTHNCTGRTTGETCTAEVVVGYLGGPFHFECTANGDLVGDTVVVTQVATPCPVPNFGPNVEHTCNNKTSAQSCTVYCARNYVGEINRYLCEFVGDEDTTPTLVKVDDNATTTCTQAGNRRLKAAETATLWHGRRLAEESCDVSSVQAAEIDIPNLTSNCDGKAHGEVCAVECAFGYVGDPILKLCEHGVLVNYSGYTGLPSCPPANCTINYPDALGVAHDCTGKANGQTCTATCSQPGYAYSSGESSTTFQCLPSGEFNGTNPVCEPAACAPLSLNQEFRTTDCINKTFGETCVVDCASGWSLVGSGEVYTCSAAGTLQGSRPSCQANPCTVGWPLDSIFETGGCESLTTQETCTVSCVDGFEAAEETYTCSPSGSLTGQRPTCTRLICQDTVSGDVAIAADCENVAFGETCTATCATGYGLTSGGSVIFTCVWDAGAGDVSLQGNALPVCSPLACEHGHPVGAEFEHNCSGTVTGGTCLVHCRSGFTSNRTVMTCQPDRSLTGDLPTCTRSKCNALPVYFPYTYDDCTNVTYGFGCFTRCLPGYVHIGLGYFVYGFSREWRCELDAGTTLENWTITLQGEDPQCGPANCIYNMPVGIQFDHNCTGISTGETCVVGCAEWYVGGEEVFECLETGNFQGTLPDCLVITTTYTTTTTTSGLRLAAQFERSFTEVVLHFTDEVLLCSDLTCQPIGLLEVECNTVLLEDQLAMFGDGAKCIWSPDHLALHVALGIGATVAPGDSVSTVSGVLTHNSIREVVDTLVAIIQRGPEPADVVGVLDAQPEQTSLCGQVHFSSAASTGGYGRALQYSWMLGPETPDSAKALLQDAVTNEMGATLDLEAMEMFLAFEAVPSTAVRPLLLDVQVNVTNWLGESAATRKVVTVLETTPSWQVQRVTPSVVTFDNFEESRFVVKVLPPDRCSDATEAVDVQPPGGVTWTYRERGQGTWNSLESASLEDTSPSSREVSFEPFTFVPGSEHELQVEVGGGNSLNFAFEVRQRAPPVARVNGPLQVSATCDFTIDASTSTDLSREPRSGTTLSFLWQCERIDGAACASSFTSTLTGPTLEVTGGVLDQGAYKFVVFVTAGAGIGAVTRNASWHVDLTSGTVPPVTVTAPWESMAHLSLEDWDTVGVGASVPTAGPCGATSNWHWQWWFVDYEMNTLLGPLSSRSSQLSSLSTTLEYSGLHSGGIYVFAILGANDSNTIDGLRAHSGFTDAEAAGVVTGLSPPFVGDRSPVPGVVRASPLEGEAFVTVFTIVTEGWTDDFSDDFQYAFYRYKIPDGVMTLDPSGNALQCDPDCPLPEIDWYNRSHPNNWLRQDIAMMKPWQAEAVVTDTFPEGAFYVIARARDDIGGSRTISVRGPLVNGMQNGVTEAAAREAAAHAAYDASALLNLATALSDSTTRAGEKSAVLQVALGAVESAAAATSGSAHDMQMFGRTVRDMARLDGAPATLLTLASTLNSAVSVAALETEHARDVEDAGDTLLEALRSLGQTYLNAGDSPQSQDADIGDKLQNTISSVKTKLAEQMEVGTAMSLSSDRFGSTSEAVTVDIVKDTRSSLSAGATFFDGQVQLPANPLASRRLASSCSEVVVSQMDWPSINIRHRVGGGSYEVPRDADLKHVQVEGCGSSLTLSSHVRITLRIPAEPYAGAPPLCLYYDDQANAWSVTGITNLQAIGGEMACEAAYSTGIYAVGFPATTTTSTSTSTTRAPPPPLSADEDTAQASGQVVVVAIVASSCSCCLVVLCGVVYFFCIRGGKDGNRHRRMFEDTDAGIDEHEHEGIGDLPKSAINISLPCGDEEGDLYEADDTEEFSIDMGPGVGASHGSRAGPGLSARDSI